MNDWEWVFRQEQEAYRQNHTSILHLARLARTQGDSYQRLKNYEEGLHLATKQGLPCWKLFFMRWIAELLFYEIDDLPAALQHIVHMGAIAPQPEYRDCPSLARALFIVVDIYYEIEPPGYEEQILAALDYMEENVILTPSVRAHCINRRGELAYHNERYNEALAFAREVLAQGGDDGAAHRLLRTVYYAQGDLHQAYAHAQLMEQVSLFSPIDAADAKLWQAALAQRMGENQIAHLRYLQGQSLYEQLNLPRWIEPYDAICEYLEYSGKPETALSVREEQIEKYTTYGSHWYESHAYLEYCRLLGRMQKPLDTALGQAKAIATRMKNPARYLQAITQIEAGNYVQFGWQR